MQQTQDLTMQLENTSQLDELSEQLIQEKNYRKVLESQIKNLQTLNEQIEEKRMGAKKDTVKAEIKLQHLQRDIEFRDIQISNLKTN